MVVFLQLSGGLVRPRRWEAALGVEAGTSSSNAEGKGALTS